MTLNGTTDVQTGADDSKRKHLLMILLGGLLIGLAASVPLAMVWPYPTPPPESICLYGGLKTRLGGITFPFHCSAAVMFVQPLVWCSFLIGGGIFGLIAHKLVGRGSRNLVVGLGALSFFIASFAGSQVVDRLPRALVLPISEIPVLFASSIEPEFSIMSFGVSLTFALAIGLALRTRGLLWRALLAATVTAICYWLVAWVLFGNANTLWNHELTLPPLVENLPALGRPMGPFMKTVLIGNFIARTSGGWATLVLLTTRS
jgi:hypothetical protein